MVKGGLIKYTSTANFSKNKWGLIIEEGVVSSEYGMYGLHQLCSIWAYRVHLQECLVDCYWQILSCQWEEGNIHHLSLSQNETTWHYLFWFQQMVLVTSKTTGIAHLALVAQNQCSVSNLAWLWLVENPLWQHSVVRSNSVCEFFQIKFSQIVKLAKETAIWFTFHFHLLHICIATPSSLKCTPRCLNDGTIALCLLK